MDETATSQHVERARTGDADALGALFVELRPDVLRLCRRLLGPNDAEDAVNEAFQRAQHRIGSYDAAQPFRRWLLSIAAHHCIDGLRRRNVEKRLFDADAPGDEVAERAGSRALSALDGIVRAETQAAVQAALDRLPDRYRAPLVLRYFAELGYDEIGEQLGVTRTQVATLVFRGKQRLRGMLRNAQEGGV